MKTFSVLSYSLKTPRSLDVYSTSFSPLTLLFWSDGTSWTVIVLGTRGPKYLGCSFRLIFGSSGRVTPSTLTRGEVFRPWSFCTIHLLLGFSYVYDYLVHLFLLQTEVPLWQTFFCVCTEVFNIDIKLSKLKHQT